MREGQSVSNTDGSTSSHKMAWGEEDKGYSVNPTIFPKKTNPSKDPKDWKDLSGKGDEMEAYKEARKRGEVVKFKSKKRAERVAAGSWKKGKDKRASMKSFRKLRKSRRNEK